MGGCFIYKRSAQQIIEYRLNNSLVYNDNMSYIITYKPNGRMGNNLFQYMTCKLLQRLWKTHRYVDYITFLSMNVQHTRLTDDMFREYTETSELPTLRSNVLCDGYFQKSKLFVSHRNSLVLDIVQSDDVFVQKLNDACDVVLGGTNFTRYPIKQLFAHKHSYIFEPEDVVVSIRLDDFIQLPCKTSDIIPPHYYLNILDTLLYKKLYIVCDELRVSWETAYMRYFAHLKPIMIQGSALHDFAVLRSAPQLLHSNSTLSWLAGFFGQATVRYIPRTHMYLSQELLAITDSDTVVDVKPLTHSQVYSLDTRFFLHPLSYAIPDELIVDDVPEKTELWASVVPGKTYTFGAGQEKSYYDMYKRARFAHTCKKGGWDALRHYEILANGCIPVFSDIAICPDGTMTTFPKALIQECAANLLPWKDTAEHTLLYMSYVHRLLDHTRRYLSCSALAHSFRKTLALPPLPKILVMRCDTGANYSREMLYIGLNRIAKQESSCCVSYPIIPFLYSDFPDSSLHAIHGMGYTYSRRLVKSTSMELLPWNEAQIVESIERGVWDLIVYAKTGPDEFREGTVPNVPLWNTVRNHYDRHRIAFLYGGDECQNLQLHDRYSAHLNDHLKYGHCFVRELIE